MMNLLSLSTSLMLIQSILLLLIHLTMRSCGPLSLNKVASIDKVLYEDFKVSVPVITNPLNMFFNHIRGRLVLSYLIIKRGVNQIRISTVG